MKNPSTPETLTYLEMEAQCLNVAIDAVAASIKDGSISLVDVLTDLYAHFGDGIDDLYPYIRRAYAAYGVEAPDDLGDRMDNQKAIRTFKYEEFKNKLKTNAAITKHKSSWANRFEKFYGKINKFLKEVPLTFKSEQKHEAFTDEHGKVETKPAPVVAVHMISFDDAESLLAAYHTGQYKTAEEKIISDHIQTKSQDRDYKELWMMSPEELETYMQRNGKWTGRPGRVEELMFIQSPDNRNSGQSAVVPKFRAKYEHLHDRFCEDDAEMAALGKKALPNMSHDGALLLEMIWEDQRAYFKVLLIDSKTRNIFRRRVAVFDNDLDDLISCGLQRGQALEYIWLPLCAEYGIR